MARASWTMENASSRSMKVILSMPQRDFSGTLKGEDEPWLKKRGTSESFASGGWLIIVLGATVFLALGANLLHDRVVASRLKRQQKLSLVTASEFEACNAGLPGRELSGLMPDSILTAPCSEFDATRIGSALRSAGYNFEAITPKPYIFPSYLQQVLFMLQGKALNSALKHVLASAPAGALGTLVKLFAWGLPVRIQDLEASLEIPVVESLRSCGLLSRCSNLKDMVTSSAMLFPVPNTTLLVATDWASRSTEGMQEDVVPIVDLESMALAYNSPRPAGLRTLDYNSGCGLQGLMAAYRGALEVSMIYTNARVSRFIRFDSWMNKLFVNVYENSLELSGHYDLMLAQPPFLPMPSAEVAAKFKRNGGKDGTFALRDVLRIASNVLDSSGTLVLFSDFNAEIMTSQDDKRNICSLGLKGFSGTSVLRSQPTTPDAYAFAHADVAPLDVQVRNMQNEHISGIASGFIFAQRQPMNALDGSGCGTFSLQLVTDPLKWPTNSTSKLDRPCYLSKETQCPESASDA